MVEEEAGAWGRDQGCSQAQTRIERKLYRVEVIERVLAQKGGFLEHVFRHCLTSETIFRPGCDQINGCVITMVI